MGVILGRSLTLVYSTYIFTSHVCRGICYGTKRRLLFILASRVYFHIFLSFIIWIFVSACIWDISWAKRSFEKKYSHVGHRLPQKIPRKS